MMELAVALVPVILTVAMMSVLLRALDGAPPGSTPMPAVKLAFHEHDASVELVRAGVLWLGWRSIEMRRNHALVDGREVPLVGYRLSRITHGASASHYRYTLSAVRADGTLRTLARASSNSHASFEGLRAAMVRQGLIRDREAHQGSSVDVPAALRAIAKER